MIENVVTKKKDVSENPGKIYQVMRREWSRSSAGYRLNVPGNNTRLPNNKKEEREEFNCRTKHANSRDDDQSRRTVDRRVIAYEAHPASRVDGVDSRRDECRIQRRFGGKRFGVMLEQQV